MACFFRCQVCNTEVPAHRGRHDYLVPRGWYVVHNGSINKRTYERIVCSGKCAGVAVEEAPGKVDIILVKEKEPK